MRAAKLMMAVGGGILLLWIAMCLVNIFRFHRFAWFFAHTRTFLYSGIVSAVTGFVLRGLLNRRETK